MKAEENLGGLLGKASRQLANTLAVDLQALGLTTQQWVLLAELSANGPRNQTDLAQALLKNKASIGSLVTYLEGKGFITRARCGGNRRALIVSLTARGNDVLSASRTCVAKTIQTALRDIDQTDIERVERTLEKIIENLRK